MIELLLEHSSSNKSKAYFFGILYRSAVRSKIALIIRWHWYPRFCAVLHVGSAVAHPKFLRRLELTLKAFSAKGSMTSNNS